MAEDFAPLLTRLRRVFPHAQLETLSDSQLAAIREQHRGVPEHYLAFMREVGWGSLGDSFMLYGGLVGPEEIFDPETAAELGGLLLFGDDLSGDVVGFDSRDGWRIVEVWHASLRVHPIAARTISEFITQQLAGWEG
jgi:hypothetical protein